MLVHYNMAVRYRKRKYSVSARSSSSKSYKKYKKTKKFRKGRAKRRGNLNGTPRKTGTHAWGTAHSYGYRTISRFNKSKISGARPYANGVTDKFQLTNTVGIQTFDSADKCILGNITDLQTYSFYAGAADTIQKLFLHHMVLNLKATNQTDANVSIDLYEYCTRQNATTTGLGSVYNSSAGPTYPQNTPFMDPTCVDFFKVLKVTRYMLAQGESFEHVMHVYPNKWIGQSLIANSGTISLLGGITYGILPIQVGMPYNDVTTKTQISLGKNVVDFVFSKHFYSYGLDNSVVADNDHNNLVTAFTVAEDIMNEDTGAAVAFAQA